MRRTCADLPAMSGGVKVAPEDFVVEEIADRPPSGSGAHLLLWVEKRGRDTRQVADELARLLGIPAVEIGVAGQKDRHAVTRQWMSVPAHALRRPEGDVSRLERAIEADALPHGPGWRVLESHGHDSKLRTGALLGNRFLVRVREGAGGAMVAEEALGRLSNSGLPNFFGPQRFGRGSDNADRGRDLLTGALVERRRHQRRLWVSALQSRLFNEWLDRRIDDDLLHTAIRGDSLRDRLLARESSFPTGVARYHEGSPREAELVRRGELDPTGPIFGVYMTPARDEEEARERAVLESADLGLEDFESVERIAPGSRRASRAWLDEVRVTKDGDDLVLGFTLERGAFATVLLAELGL